MDNEVVIHVRSKDETEPGFRSAREAAERLDNDLVIEIKAKDETDRAFDSVKRRAADLDDDLVVKIRAKDETDDVFEKVKAKAKKLGDETGQGFGKSGGKKAAEGWAEGFIGSIGSMSPVMVKAGIAAVAVMAPQIGATIAGAVVGIGGFTGVVGGLVAAAGDSRVQTSAHNLAEQVGKNLQAAAVSFVPHTLDALDKVKLAWRELTPTIQNIFLNSGKFLGPLTDGLIRMVSRIAEGIDVAVGKAGPVMEAFGDMFAEVGDAVGDLFEMMAEDSEIGAVAIRDFGEIIGGVVRDFGGFSHELSKVKEEWEMWQEGFRKSDAWMEDHVSWLDVTADGYEKGSEAALLFRDGIIGAAGSANDYDHYLEQLKGTQETAIEATEKHTEALQALADQMQKQTDPLFNLIDLEAKVTKGQEDYTKALGEGGPESAKAQKALLAMGKNAFELNTAMGAVAEGFDGHFTPAMRTALRNAKLTDAQINALEKRLIAARKAANAWEGTFEQTFRVREIISSTGERTYAGGGGRQAPISDRGASGKIKGAASGMLAGGLTWAGENGPELLKLPPGSQMHSNPDSRRMVAGMGSDGASMGGGPVTIYLTVDGQTIATAVLPSLQKINRNDFAGDVTRMFPATR